MEGKTFQVNTNPMEITSIAAFANLNGQIREQKKDVYFVRYIGYEEEEKYLEEIQQMDRLLGERHKTGKGAYLRVERPKANLTPELAAQWGQRYDAWKESGGKNFGLEFHFPDELREDSKPLLFEKILNLYERTGRSVSLSMVRNFGIKVLYWADLYLPQLFGDGSAASCGGSPKLVVHGPIKIQEYLFLYFMVSLGCDVLCLCPWGDLEIPEELLRLSCRYAKGAGGHLKIPPYNPAQAMAANLNGKLEGSHRVGGADLLNRATDGVEDSLSSNKISRDRLIHPARRAASKPAATSAPPSRAASSAASGSGPVSQQNNRPLDYEELAKLSPSIVMISVYNREGECFKTGSGVVISPKGYILTNFHVACEGAYYSIRFEEEEQLYETDELVKYNQIHDLAVIKIDKNGGSLPVYSGMPLSRGQKVVAIGSPLGLFNSISDGIISGFRTFGDMSMIQFTAPTSHGSSGGALLNLYGELIGIITGGFDDGQNINLAVDYKTVRTFAGGFL